MDNRAPISKRELKTSAAYISLIVGVIVVSSLLLFTQFWFLWPLILVSLLVAVGYTTASKSHYQCPSCGEAFKITALQDFFALHGITRNNGQLLEWKQLKCPQCHTREKCYRVQET